jgi:UDP-3-O-[3-hydroxymyristoyl] glucosamine N-acyltransferase
MLYTLAELAEALGLPFQGNGPSPIQRVSSWESADARSLVFVEPDRALPQGFESFEGSALAPPGKLPPSMNVIFTAQPKLDFARAAGFLYPQPSGRGIKHETAVLAPGSEVAPSADVGPNAVIGVGAVIGDGCVIGAGTVVGEGCRIGKHCILHPRVVLYPGVTLGDRVILHSGVVVGSDGFGYVANGKGHVKFPQAGTVVIADDVEIGANTTVDRGSLGTTRIGKGTKIDNLVQIAHNVELGQSVIIAALTGISGSSVIEDFAVLGGQVGMGDHARVQTGAIIGSKAGILPGKIVRSGDVYWGVPVRPLREYKRLNAYFGRLPEFKADIDALKKAVAEIRKLLP